MAQRIFCWLCILAIAGCGDWRTVRQNREKAERKHNEENVRKSVLARYPGIKDFSDETTESFMPKITIVIQDDVAAHLDRVYWIEADDFDVFRRGKQPIVAMRTLEGSLVSLSVNESQLAQLLRHSPARYTDSKYMFVFSLASVSPLSLGEVFGAKSYEGELKEVAVLNEGQSIQY